jgi:DNA modification methylase
MTDMAQNNGHITTAQYSISDLIFAEYNPRELTKDQHQDLKDSITRFGLVDPLIVNIHKERKNILVGGHQRLRIAKELGYKSVSCVEVELTPEKEKELNVRLNKNTGQWDWDALANHFDVGELLEWGFSEDELQFTEPDVQGLTDDDDIPEVEEAITKQGDLWLLGEHRLLCGDATKKEDVEALMGGEKADMVFTDPPYGMNAVKNSGVLSKKYKDIKNDDSTDAAIKSFRLLDADIPAIWWGANYYANALPNKSHWIVWDKNNGGSDQMDCELAWTNLKGVTRQFTLSSEKKNRVHPTQKPVELISWSLDKVNPKSVIDLFLGSGSTLIACEKLNRKCFGMEIDPHYCDVIVKRWEEYTGNKAERIEAASA